MEHSAQHIAIIMDGNGRWAQARGHNRLWGHIRGARVARDIIEFSANMGLENLTLFAFSSENWKRPQTEVNFLMKLLRRQLIKETARLVKNNIRFNYIGDISLIPESSREAVVRAIKETSHCTGMKLTFALSYGGRQELVTAVKELAVKLERGELRACDITEELVSENLESSFLPDPDLIIRTSGEQRLSNFLLWQSAYSEFEFTPILWPDFTSKDFKSIVTNFLKRERRYGQTSQQVEQFQSINNELQL